MLWSVGNGLTTGAVISYLAMDLGARGLALSLILALPALVGLLRVAAPAVIAWLATTRRMAIVLYTASYLLLLGVPWVAATQADNAGGLAAGQLNGPLLIIVALVCVHQLLEYLASVALWSWLADLVPQRIRGRYFARRQVFQLCALIPTLAAGAVLVDAWRRAGPSGALQGYSIVIALGALLLLGSVAPLVMMPPTRAYRPSEPRRRWLIPPLSEPLGNVGFRRLLVFGCWFSLFNGLTQSPMNIYPKAVLELGLLELVLMQMAMRLGQAGVSLWAGPASDRYGNRPVLIVCQMLVASGPLFYLLATPAQPYWLLGAWLVWAAYAGLNICLPNLLLKLSPRGRDAPYIATYFAATSLCYAASTLAGGWLFDAWPEWLGGSPGEAGINPAGRYEWFFWIGWFTRTLGVVWLVRIMEPGAWSLGAIILPYLRRSRTIDIPEPPSLH